MEREFWNTRSLLGICCCCCCCCCSYGGGSSSGGGGGGGWCGVITSGTLCRDFVEDERLNLLVREEVRGQGNSIYIRNYGYVYIYIQTYIYIFMCMWLYVYIWWYIHILYIICVYIYNQIFICSQCHVAMSFGVGFACKNKNYEIWIDMGFCQILSVRSWDVGLSRRVCNGRCFNTMAPLPAAFWPCLDAQWLTEKVPCNLRSVESLPSFQRTTFYNIRTYCIYYDRHGYHIYLCNTHASLSTLCLLFVTLKVCMINNYISSVNQSTLSQLVTGQ